MNEHTVEYAPGVSVVSRAKTQNDVYTVRIGFQDDVYWREREEPKLSARN